MTNQYGPPLFVVFGCTNVRSKHKIDQAGKWKMGKPEGGREHISNWIGLDFPKIYGRFEQHRKGFRYSRSLFYWKIIFPKKKFHKTSIFLDQKIPNLLPSQYVLVVEIKFL